MSPGKAVSHGGQFKEGTENVLGVNRDNWPKHVESDTSVVSTGDSWEDDGSCVRMTYKFVGIGRHTGTINAGHWNGAVRYKRKGWFAVDDLVGQAVKISGQPTLNDNDDIFVFVKVKETGAASQPN